MKIIDGREGDMSQKKLVLLSVMKNSVRLEAAGFKVWSKIEKMAVRV